MKYKMGSRILSMILVICMMLGMVPAFVSHVAVEAEAVSGVNNLTCASFISNTTRRTYIDTMMKYYINNNSKLQTCLDNGKSVVFMFEGGSDKYDSYEYVDACGTTRLQAVCIVVQKNSSGNAYIAFYSENCSSIPDDANWVSPGYETSGSTTILDGIYSFQTVNHNGNYAAHNTGCYTGWYTPYDGTTGYAGYCDGINIHTRGVSYSGGASYGWANSAGCQVIGYGASSSNEYNEFMKVVAGITFNAYDGTQRTMSNTYVDKGYYVVDRQLGLVSPSGTEYGSGSLASLYTKTDLANITEYSTNARANANFGYLSDCTPYASHCEIKVTEDTTVNSLPCSTDTDSECEIVEYTTAGDTYTAVKLYQNTYGNYWYEVVTASGDTGYIYADEATYVKQLTSDITLTGATYPNGHVAGNIFYVEGTIKSDYNELTEASVYVYSGFGTSGSVVTGDSDTVGGNSYTLVNSNIDYNTAFNSVPTGNHTYAVAAKYRNYYATDAKTLQTNTGTINLLEKYFVVVSSSVDQSTCSHSNTTTTIKAATCTASGTSVTSCSKCGLVTENTVSASGHSYGAWTTVNATCTTDGSKTRTCSVCKNVETQNIAATGHKYNSTSYDANCQDYKHVEYICGTCGHSYKDYDDAIMTAWQTTKPNVDESLIETKTQYRYSDYETTTSYETSLAGYTQISSKWEQSGTGAVEYVKDWSSGFSTGNSLYTKYNKASSKKTASETETDKITINSDAITGYLYFHWCYADSYYSAENQSGSYTTFHAYYDTTSPDNFTCDTSDMSYKTSHSTCSNSEWFFVDEVYTQKYTTYKKLFTYERWTDYSAWSDTVATASDTRKVETRTLYRYVNGEMGEHNYVSGTCTVCGEKDPTVIPTITPKYPTVSFEDEIIMNVFYTASDLGDTGLEDMGLITWSTPQHNGTVENAETMTSGASYDSTIGMYWVNTDGIAAKKLSDTIYFKVYAKLSNGEYAYSSMLSYSPKTYATSVLNGNYGTDMKALVVSMLNYGAAAQTYFNYKPYKLMNADLTAAQKALVKAYDSSMVSPVVSASSSKTGNFVNNGGFSRRYPTISFEGAFAINYFFTPSNTVNGNVTLYYWNQSDCYAADVLTVDNATAAIPMTLTAEGYVAAVEGIAAKDLDRGVYIAVVYSDGSTTYSSGLISYSIGTYCRSQAAKGNALSPLAAACAVYSYYAKVLFYTPAA